MTALAILRDASGTHGENTDVLSALRHANDELRRARDEAERANRAKSEFLANMSHELRTPLNSVIGFATVLLKNRSGGLSAQDLAFLQRINDNGRHLLGLINDVLDLSKIEAGKLQLEIADVALDALVAETIDGLGGNLKPGIQLKKEVPRGLQTVRTDRHKLKQVLINLIGNALKFTESGAVTVWVAPDDEGRPIRIDVIDTGIGIPADKLDAIFQAFQQADSSTSRVYGGTGLGLAITRSILTALGHDISVSSEVGTGSTFSIRL